MKTPVAFFIFNRPDTTRRVFAEIAKVKPSKLLVVADGPRPDRVGEAERCAQARAVIEAVDWPCEVLTDFSPTNLGCKNRMSSGLDWVFSTVEEAILLEDDCLPHPDFFPYCETLLERYRHDERIMTISGVNFQNGRQRGDGSYFFARYCHVWGWASWRRAWQHYDVAMASFPAFVEQDVLARIFPDPRMQRHWLGLFRSAYEGRVDTWDYQWVYALWSQNGLAIMPNVNLVTNIGFSDSATHTKDWLSDFAGLPVAPLGALRHPTVVAADMAADVFTWRIDNALSLYRKIGRRCRRLARRMGLR
jgi:hypothetical protein